MAALIRELHGPSLFAAHPALLLEFEAPRFIRLEAARMLRALEEASIPIGPEALSPTAATRPSLLLSDLVARLASWLDQRSNPDGRPTLSLAASRSDDHVMVAASFVEQQRSARILLGAFGIARVLLDRYAEESPDAVLGEPRLDRIRRLRDEATIAPDFDSSHELIVARARLRGIPALVLPGTPRVLLLGQGRHGRLMRATSNDRDSAVGTLLAADKSWANTLILRLGFPGVRHKVVHHEDEAAAAAKAIGFPLVVKPVANGKGTGVFAGITSAEECRAAIREALQHSRRGVLVEAHVDGDDHRLAVFGGRFAWAVARRPASVCGDGRLGIEALIRNENARRLAIPPAERHLVTTIDVDAELVAHLAKSGLTLQTVPAAGQRVTLRSIANVSRGGSFEDVTSRVHPDNRAMAEAIAGAFRMDALGVDFLTTDITRSWRETGGAVIEINETPGAGTPHYVDTILATLYPKGSPARVPYLLFAGDALDVHAREAVADARLKGHVVGFVDASTTAVNDELRGRKGQTLNERMQSLLPEPRISMIIARLTGPDLAREGILLERIDRAFIGAGLSNEIEALVRGHCADVRVVTGAAAS